MIAERSHARQGGGDIWIFAYGSLMWRPDMPFAEAQPARLTGYHRSFCIYSTYHRGDPARPGLVLGLDRGQVCDGIAYRVATSDAGRVVEQLRKRELIYGVYREAVVPVLLTGETHRQVRAIAFIVERAHPSYAAALPLAEQVQLIRSARGVSGTNLDYLINTARHLRELAIRERVIERTLTLAGSFLAHGAEAHSADSRSRPLLQAWRRHPVRARRIRPAEHRRFLYRLRLSAAHLPAAAQNESISAE
jgi:cation transport protein ChaC